MTAENSPERSVARMLAVTFLPKKLVVWLTVLGFFFGVMTATVPTNWEVLPGVLTLVMFGWALVAALVGSLKQKGHRRERLWRTLTVTAGIAIISIALRELSRFLAFMAAGGNEKVDYGLFTGTTGPTSGIPTGLILLSVVILIWIPDACFRIRLDMSGAGDAQRVLLGLLITTSCILTGAAFLLLHFDGGPLRNVSIGTLVVGVIGVVLLVAPPYRSLAKACWQRGIVGVFSLSNHARHWRNMAMELEEAMGSIALSGTTPPRAPRP